MSTAPFVLEVVFVFQVGKEYVMRIKEISSHDIIDSQNYQSSKVVNCFDSNVTYLVK